MSDAVERITELVEYAQNLTWDEKSEAQVYCDRFRAFGHKRYAEAGAPLKFRLEKKSGKGVKFAELVWKPRILIEMKKGGEKLHLHYQQAFDHWLNAVPNRPRYVVLCNFGEFWTYDFDKQMNEPVDVVPLAELPWRYTALNFLFPDNPDPLFGNDREEVSRTAASNANAERPFSTGVLSKADRPTGPLLDQLVNVQPISGEQGRSRRGHDVVQRMGLGHAHRRS